MPGLRLEYTAQAVGGVAPTPADMAAIASILRARIDPMGFAGPTVTTHDLVVVVDLPGVTEADAETVRKVLGQTGKVGFVPLGETQVTEGAPLDLATYPPLFGGDQIAKATVGTDQNGRPAIEFVLQAGRGTPVRRVHRGPHRELLRDHARWRRRVGAGHPERDHEW